MTKEEALEAQRALRTINEWLMDRENKKKAPNKVHIAPMRSKGYVGIAWAEEHGEGYVEYIRKDALLEWAKDNLLECEVSNDDTDYGRIDVYKKLIDKIKSL